MKTHKKLRNSWHRDHSIAPCGLKIFSIGKFYKRNDLKPYSYKWTEVTCSSCLNHMKVLENKTIRKLK